MIMNIYVIAAPFAALFVFLIAWICLRCFLWLLSWHLSRKHRIHFKVEVRFLSLNNISLFLPSGSSLEIEKIWISCCILPSNYRSFITICVTGVTALVNRKQNMVGEADNSSSENSKDSRHAIKSIPNYLLSLSKIVSFHFTNVDVKQRFFEDNQCHVFQSIISEFGILFRGSCYENSSHEISTISGGSYFKLFKSEQISSKSCLFSFGINLECSIHLSLPTLEPIQRVKIQITSPEVVIAQGFQPEIIGKIFNVRKKKPALESSEQNTLGSVETVLAKIPKGITVKIESFDLKWVQCGCNRTLAISLQTVDFDSTQTLDLTEGHLMSSLLVQNVTVSSGQLPLASLVKSSAKLKVESKTIDVNLQLSSWHLMYNYDELNFWGKTLFPTSKSKKLQLLKPSIPKKQNQFIPLLQGFKIQGQADINDIFTGVTLPNCTAFSAGLMHSQLTFDFLYSVEGSHSKVLGGLAEINLELLLEMAWCTLGDGHNINTSVLKRHHQWNTPICLGMLLLKARDFPSDFRIQCMVDGIKGEVSPKLISLLVQLHNFKIIGGEVISKPVTDDVEKVPWKLKEMCSLQFSLTGANIFMLSEHGVGLMVRIDSVTLDTAAEKIFFISEGFKLMSFQPSGMVFPCLKSSEMRHSVIHIQTTRLTYKTALKEISLQLLDEVKTEWTTSVHMCAVSLADEINHMLAVIKKPDKVERLTEVEAKPGLRYLFTVKLHGKINLSFIISKTHRFSFIGNEFSAKAHPGRTTFKSDHMQVNFDDHPIFTFLNWSVSSVRESEGHVVNRQTFEGLEKKTNKAWSIIIDDLKMVFPYEYNFAEAFSEQTMSVVKWLKKLHRKEKNTFDLGSPLPADLAIKVKIFTMDLNDDPFEVKLRDNYELLEDEFIESLKRKMMLDDKIDKLRKTHLLLPTGKVDELYVALSKKNADIYIQRSKQLYGSNSMRTSLFSVQFENIELFAVADMSYHGRDRVVQAMQEIDPDSPFPDEGLEFSTLWCRKVGGSIQSILLHLRDFPQALLEIREFHIWGRLIGAEQEPSKRAKRESVVEIDAPWGNDVVERSMPSLKFYHELTWDVESLCAAQGPCWEPILAQVGLSFDSISKPSADPSPTLPWWDKMRLLYHGRLTISAQHLTMLYQASLDPFNTTEQMEFTWTNVLIDWTNAKITMKGDLDIYVHTASKYDDCRLLHMPNVKLSFKLEWLCLGNPDDHHNVMPCAPDKVPEYSSNQMHDSYRAFRSQNLNISLSMETKPMSLETLADIPCMLLYSSTLRWIENMKVIMGGTSRLVRRGILFGNTKPRKPQLGRHYRISRLAINFHKFRVCYWMSFAKQRGFELLGGRFSLGSEHTLALKPIEDGLKHRPRADWSISYLTCDLVESEVWLYNSETKQHRASNPDVTSVDRSYFVSMTRVSYGRETIMPESVNQEQEVEDPPTHRLVFHGLKGAWTKSNRDVIFSLYDSYAKSKQMKRNLSTDALKGLKMEPQMQRSRSHTSNSNNSQSAAANSASPITRLQSGHVASMLQKLISEAEANTMVYIEEIEGTKSEQQLHGVSACQTDDVVRKNWLIELVNSQMMLRGCETPGYIIVSAARTEILQRVHTPVWKERSLVSKTTWVGSFECLQYYATVDGGSQSPSMDNIIWLSIDNIEEKPSVISDLPDLVGSGHSVGGVVSSTVGGAADPGSAPLQLQRIVSRCSCQFFYASYGENMEPDSLGEAPPLPEENDPWESQTTPCDSFTLTHHDLTVCTNSMQYAMILDIINNVLLYVEPRKKEAFERLQGMRFRLQLSSTEDHRGPILELQNQIRILSLNLRRLEKETYQVQRSLDEGEGRGDLQQQLEVLAIEFEDCKEKLLNASDELNMMINCYRETQVSALKTRQRAAVQNQSVTPVRRSEVCFRYAQWRLTDADGQLGLADFTLSNFIYTKVTRSDDSVEHLLELGHIKAANLLPNQAYKDVLRPTELQPNIPLDRQRALRIFCRERAPVGGISVKEHFEVNVIPITIGLTHSFVTHMMRFFFPGRYTDTDQSAGYEEQGSSSKLKKKATLGQQRVTSIPVTLDDISKMRERAEKNQTFLYIKIPEVPLRVSYKGGKEKNIEDLHEVNLNLHTLEYHNRTWTWLDLLMEMKNDSQKALLQQAIKQKLTLKSRSSNTDESSHPQEEDKARLLLGTKLVGGPEKPKKSLFGKSSGK